MLHKCPSPCTKRFQNTHEKVVSTVLVVPGYSPAMQLCACPSLQSAACSSSSRLSTKALLVPRAEFYSTAESPISF